MSSSRSNIARAGASREVAPPRSLPAGDTLPRARSPGEENNWALQPEWPPHLEPHSVQLLSDNEQPPTGRANRSFLNPPRAAASGDLQWTADPLSGRSEELGHASTLKPEASGAPLWLTRRREPRLRPGRSDITPPAPAPASDAKLGPSADQKNHMDIAQRLEAALRRPNRTEETRVPPAAPKMEEPEPEGTEMEELSSAQDSLPAPRASPSPDTLKAPCEETQPAGPEGRPAPQKSLYDSLEQEMASLQDRSDNKKLK